MARTLAKYSANHRTEPYIEICIFLFFFIFPGVLGYVLMKIFRMRALFDEPFFSYYRTRLQERFLKKNQPLTDFTQSNQPFPIFNASANNNKRIMPFEITPFACGSLEAKYIKTEELPIKFYLADAMTISGSAINLVNHAWNWKFVFSIFSGGTGYWFPQFSGRLECLDYLSLAWKLLANVPSERMPRVYDGGYTDNLGLIALLRRNVELIVCVDAAYDPEFLFDDLRKVCSFASSAMLAEIDASPIQQLMHDLRFESNKNRFVKLQVKYLKTEKSATIIYLKLDTRSGQSLVSRADFAQFPQITTNDQRLTEQQLKDLYSIGKALADESINEVIGHCYGGAVMTQ